ncbi:MAG: UDP-3-O-acyl-N-acetylglucosamine deacetylase [Acidobacteria bacterium]|nr:UDP-3-O-acyl-N-acetylglucosamine deacetylase [Acidobacteriota bacterium]
MKQTTLARELKFSGVGLHSGFRVTLGLVPAPPNTGIVFRRLDLNDFEIEALRRNVAKVNFATTLMKQGVMISTVEHIMSAVYGLGIDNLYICVDSLEIPILDGSAQPFVEAIREVGLENQNCRREYIHVLKPFHWSEKGKSICLEPYQGLRVTCVIDFPHPLIGVQKLDLLLDPGTYRQQICFARTFGFYRQVEALLKNNLIRGGSYDNAIVLSDDGIVNGKLRRPDEFVRHKALDLIGDIALLGKPLLGHVKAYRAGHAAHATFVGKFLQQTDAYQIAGLAPQLAT